MRIQRNFQDGANITILVPLSVRLRLFKTCFRGKHRKLAGNFCLWDWVWSFFSDPLVVDEFVASLEEIRNNQEFGKWSLTIEHNVPVGWESTDRTELYHNEDLEEFHPNRKSSALRVRPDRTDLRAPLTNKFTIVFDFHFEKEKHLFVVVRSIYPGVDVGELKGNITAREQRVFFTWDHPGK
jgi:hypothetical protein